MLKFFSINLPILFGVFIVLFPHVRTQNWRSLIDIYPISAFAAILICIFAFREPLSFYEELKCRWYLFNAFVFHTLLDFGVGVLHIFPLMDEQYQIIDGRFKVDHSVSSVIGIIEALVMFPLCFASFYAIKKRKPWKNEIEVT